MSTVCSCSFLDSDSYSYRSHSVGLATVSDLSSGRAVGRIGSHDLSGVLDRLGAIIVGSSASHEGGGSGDHGGTHF